jgi:hypothetical protein
VPVAQACNPSTQEAKIRKIVVQSQPGEIVLETLSLKNPSQKRAGGVAQGIGPEFKHQCRKKKKKKKKKTLYQHVVLLKLDTANV